MKKLKLDELNRVSVAEFKKKAKIPIAIVLDDVRSMHNIGSIFRTADAFAIAGIYLCGTTAQPPRREIEKTALGATQAVDWFYFDQIATAIAQLRINDYEIIAIEQAENSILLNDFLPKKHKQYALIFGNEVHGLSEKAMQTADACIEIPQFGTKHSFNIVISAGIVLWDFFIKMNQK